MRLKLPNAETEDGITPLLLAVAAGSLTCLQLLIEAGASANIKPGGATPLHVAADAGSKEIIICLLNAGGDPNVLDKDGLKPIQVAAARGNRVAVQTLFPVTSPLSNFSKWSVDGIIEFMESQTSKEQESANETQDLKGLTSENSEIVEAIDLNPNEPTLLSNRSLCWIRLGQAEQALADAKACRSLKPNWAKACYREGAALRLLQRFDEAANAFYEGVKLDPENKELVDAFRSTGKPLKLGENFMEQISPSKENNGLLRHTWVIVLLFS